MISVIDRIKKLAHWQITIIPPIIDRDRFCDIRVLRERFRGICSDIESKFSISHFPMLNISEQVTDDNLNVKDKLVVFSNHKHEVMEHVKVDLSGKVIFNNIFRLIKPNKTRRRFLLTNEVVHKLIATTLFARHWSNEVDADSVEVKIEMFGLHGLALSFEDPTIIEARCKNRLATYSNHEIKFEISRESSTNALYDHSLNISNLICQHFDPLFNPAKAFRTFLNAVTRDESRHLVTESVNIRLI